LPQCIEAIRLAVRLSQTPDHELPNAILETGTTIDQATVILMEGLGCSVTSVRKSIEDILLRLYAVLQNDPAFNLIKRLSTAANEKGSTNKTVLRLLERVRQTPAVTAPPKRRKPVNPDACDAPPSNGTPVPPTDAKVEKRR
jgi:hypothetical protein